MEDHQVEEVYNSRQLLHHDSMDHILDEAISAGMLVQSNGDDITTDDISEDDKYEMMGIFIHFLIKTNRESSSRFMIAKA
jgi:hypothetical protein|tara:strand:- start:185 stop:424 length:240 start_codon:yes stop_codon:yes gene_type:complete